MTTPLSDTDAQRLAIQALELMIAAKTLLAAAHSEPSVEPSDEELALIRAAKAAEGAMHQQIANIGRNLQRTALPKYIESRLYPKEGDDLLAELRQDAATDIFSRI